MQDWGWMVSPHLNYGIWSLQFLETRIRVRKIQHFTQFKNENNLEEWSMFWKMLTLFPKTSNFRIKKLCCMCLRTMKQLSRWFSREEPRQWDMFPEPTELLLIGYSIESIFTTKSKSNTLTPKKPTRRHTDQGKFHTWWMESSFVVV